MLETPKPRFRRRGPRRVKRRNEGELYRRTFQRYLFGTTLDIGGEWFGLDTNASLTDHLSGVIPTGPSGVFAGGGVFPLRSVPFRFPDKAVVPSIPTPVPIQLTRTPSVVVGPTLRPQKGAHSNTPRSTKKERARQACITTRCSKSHTYTPWRTRKKQLVCETPPNVLHSR